MNEYDKPPPYSPEAPPTTQQPMRGQPTQHQMGGYQGGAGVPPTSFNTYSGVPPASTGTYSGVPPGYQVVNPAVIPAYGSTVYIQQPPISPQVVLVGGCPACRVGVLEEDFTCLGVCMAIFFFPLGILCCLAMMQRRCPNCGAVFS